MRKSKWPPEKIAQMLAMVDAGCTRREIAARMDLIINAVTSKLFRLGVAVPLGEEPPPSAGHLARLRNFPPFADVSRAEAHLIIQGAPPSGVFAPQHAYSLMGNATCLWAIV